MLLTIIIVSYNTEELTLQTLESVRAEISGSKLLKNKTEIFLVDNNSHDDSVSAVKTWKKKHPEFSDFVHIIANETNTGFATANNQAIAEAQGKYILLLNSDTIVQPGSLEQMVRAFEDIPIQETTAVLATEKQKIDRLGVLAATLLNTDGTLQPQGGAFPTLLSLAGHMLFLDDLPVIGRIFPSTQYTGRNVRTRLDQDTSLIKQDWVGGTAMMIRKDVIEEVGPLDQNIFMYAEDIEFCMRARDHHWDVAIHPTAHITHLGSASSSSANAIIGELKGYLYIWSKHKPLWQRPFVKGLLWWGVILRITLFKYFIRDTRRATIYGRALQDVIR